jgi:hypothetical protein
MILISADILAQFASGSGHYFTPHALEEKEGHEAGRFALRN